MSFPHLFPLIAVAACALVGTSTTAHAADAVLGKWLGTAGSPDNQAVVGFGFTEDAKGKLACAVTVDLLNCYGVAAPSVEVQAGGVYKLPDFGIELTLTGDRLAGTLPGGIPFELRRVDELPVEPPIPSDLRPGPEPGWRTKLGAPIWATVATHNGFAFVGTQGGVFHAVNIATGDIAWTFRVGAPVFGEALVTDAGVYFCADNGFLFKLDHSSGKEVWRYDLGDGRAGRVLPHPSVFDYDHEAPSPVLAAGTLFIGSGDGGFHAVREATGERIWHFPAKGKIRGTAVVNDDHVLFGTLENFLYALDRTSGREVWRKDTNGALTGSPAMINGTLVAGTRGAELFGFSPDSGETLWRIGFWGSWVESTPAAAGELAVIGSSDLRRVTCFDPKDGRIVWRTDVFGWTWGRPLVTADAIYVATSGARPYMIRHTAGLVALDRATGQIRWRRPFPEPSGAYCWGFANGFARDAGMLIIGDLDGTLYAFPEE